MAQRKDAKKRCLLVQIDPVSEAFVVEIPTMVPSVGHVHQDIQARNLTLLTFSLASINFNTIQFTEF